MFSLLATVTIPRGSIALGKVIDNAVGRCVARWGGCTVTDGIGYWRGLGTGVTDVEPVAQLAVECYATSEWEIAGWFDRLADDIRIDADQHAVYWRATAGQARFIERDSILAPEPDPTNKEA